MTSNSVDFFTVDVFTDRRFGGNPLAVFPHTPPVDDATLQAIAREFNLSETVFVLPPEDPNATRRLRIFTPAAELPFAGHPTVGAACLLGMIGEVPLVEEGEDLVFEEGVGSVAVRLRRLDGEPAFARMRVPLAPEQGPEAPPRDLLAAALGLTPEDVLDGDERSATFTCGLPFTFVPLRGPAALARAAVSYEAWACHLSSIWAPNLFVFCRDPDRPIDGLRARMFAPSLGIPEDPATGSAVAALAGWLSLHRPGECGPFSWKIRQGVEMGRPSLLMLQFDGGDGEMATDVRVGGHAVLVSEGTLYLDARAERARAG